MIPSISPSSQLPPTSLPSLPPSAAPSPLLLGGYPLSKWLRVSGTTSRPASASVSPGTIYSTSLLWSPSHQEQFEQRLICLIAFAGFPLTWVDNPEFHAFVAEFVSPAALVPTHFSLDGHILKRALEHACIARNKQIEQESNRNGTIQFDGWTGLNSRHYNAFMATLADQVNLNVANQYPKSHIANVDSSTSSMSLTARLHAKLGNTCSIFSSVL